MRFREPGFRLAMAALAAAALIAVVFIDRPLSERGAGGSRVGDEAGWRGGHEDVLCWSP